MNPTTSALAAAAAALLATMQPAAVHAQPVSQAQSSGPGGGSFTDFLLSRKPPAGERPAEPDGGVDAAVLYTNDLLRNASGGIRRGTVDQGKLELQVTVDLEKTLGMQGSTFYANGFNTHNTGRIRRDVVGGLNTIAAIEAKSSTRLSELWLERRWQNDSISLRIGQLAADTEFFFADLSAMFLQSDYPSAAANNQPGGGPAYPLSTPGVRLRFDLGPRRDTTLLFAVFNGNPAGPCAGDPDTCNRHGLEFRVRDPALLKAEAQFRTNQGKDDSGLARQVKLGAWYHLGRFDDLRLDSAGRSLANAASNGMPATYRGNWGAYGIVDQQVFRPAGGDAASGISVYSRAAFNPADRNAVTVYVDGGIVFNGLLPQRPDDKFGIAFIHTRLSGRLRALDLERIAQGKLTTPPRDRETNLEVSYAAKIVPGWTLQPAFTYVAHPSGTGVRYPDARVFGVRSTMQF